MREIDPLFLEHTTHEDKLIVIDALYAIRNLQKTLKKQFVLTGQQKVLLEQTENFLVCVGDPAFLFRLKAYRDYWASKDYLDIVLGFGVRIKEAEFEEPVYDEPEVDYDIINFINMEEEAPYTQRSLIAMVNIFNKLVLS